MITKSRVQRALELLSCELATDTEMSSPNGVVAASVLRGGLPSIGQALAQMALHLVDIEASVHYCSTCQLYMGRREARGHGCERKAKPSESERAPVRNYKDRHDPKPPESEPAAYYVPRPNERVRVEWGSSKYHKRVGVVLRTTREPSAPGWEHEWAGEVLLDGESAPLEFGPCLVSVQRQPKRFTAPEPLPVGARVRIVELGSDGDPTEKVGAVFPVEPGNPDGIAEGMHDSAGNPAYLAGRIGGGTWVRTVELVEEPELADAEHNPHVGSCVQCFFLTRERDELKVQLQAAQVGHDVYVGSAEETARQRDRARDELEAERAKVAELETKLANSERLRLAAARVVEAARGLPHNPQQWRLDRLYIALAAYDAAIAQKGAQ